MATTSIIQEGEAHPTLSHHAQLEIGDDLQATLAELVDLTLVGKQFHWSVVGPTFKTLHLSLDELVAEWGVLAASVAERALAVGAWPDGQATAVIEASEFASVPAGPIRDEEVLRLLTSRLIEVVAHTRSRMDELGTLDLASQDVLVDVVRTLEQQLWMIRAQRSS